MAVMALVGYGSISSYKEQLASQEASISELNTFVEQDVGKLIDCYVVNTAVRVGDTVTEEMLTPITIPEKIAYADKEVEILDENGNSTGTELQKTLNVITSTNDVVGKQFRIALEANSILSPDDIVDTSIDDTVREYQLIFDDFPTDIQVGDYVDIRIRFTYGEDFIAIPYKRVEALEINNGLFTMYFSEYELNTYNSMLLDKAMYESTEIYILKYLDPSSQSAAEGFYPINDNVSEIINANPNLLKLVEEQMELERAQLNSIMGGDISSFDSKRLNEVTGAIRDISKDLASEKSNSIKERVKAEAAAAKEAAKANK